jgi:diguanylate cyclase (GGDEF)-like protein
LGYLIKRNKKVTNYRINTRETIKEIIRPGLVLKESEIESNQLKIDVKKLQNAIRDSLGLLRDILSPHSIVLYIRREDGLFEIGDFISNSAEYIDCGQKLYIRSGYLGWVVKTKTSVLLGDIKNRKENLIYYTRDIPVKSLIVNPIIIEEEEDQMVSRREPIGILLIDSLEQNAFGEKEKLVVSLASSQIAHVLDKAELSQKIQLSSQELNSFYEFTKKLSSTLELDSVLDHIIDTIGEVLEADVLAITLLDRETNTSILKRAGKEKRKDIENKIIPHQDTIIGLVSETKEYFHFEDLSLRKKYRSVFGKEIDFALGIKNVKSILIYPLKELRTHSNQEVSNVLGCVVVGRIVKRPFNEAEKSIARIISQEGAKAISNSLNYLKVKELAITDGLTGLYNYRYFQELLSHIFARSDRCPERVSLMLIDVDNFKQVNDTYGHKTGDIVLASIARMVSNSLRRIDVSARYGGDEFAVVLPNTGKEGAIFAAKKIKQNMERAPLQFKGEEIRVTLSIGIATYPDNARTKDLLLEKADRALYEAKNQGRNTIIHYEDIALREVGKLI